MTINLGIDIRRSGLHGSVAVDGDVTPVDFGPDGEELPFAAHVGADGEVLVGGAAIREGADAPAGLLQSFFDRLGDPARYQVNGHAVSAPLLLAHLLTDVVARVVHSGLEPDSIVIALPDDSSAAIVAGVRAAAEFAELDIARIVPSSEAAAAGADAAAGAALLLAVPPIVDPNSTRLLTKEDLEGPSEPAPQAPLEEPRYETVGPPTVFAETTAVPVVPPTAAAPSGPSVMPTPPANANNRAVLAGIGGAAAAILVVALLVWLFTRGGDDDEVATTSSTALAASTTVAVSTSGVPSSVTTVPATSTSTTASSTSTSTSTTTTTIPRVPGDAALSAVGLVLNPGRAGETTVRLDSDADDAVTAISAVLGSPDSDSGWELEELCDADESRFLRYGDIEVVLFATITVTVIEPDPPPEPDPDADPPEEEPPPAEPIEEVERTETFAQWYLGSVSGEPADLYLFGDLLGLGDTVGTYNSVLGNDLTVSVSGERGILSIDGPGGRTIDGLATGPTATDTVTQLWAGRGCDRGF